MRKSSLVIDSIEVRTFCSVRILTICKETPTKDWISFFLSKGVPILTTMTMSAPIALTTSTGRLRVNPPSR